MRYHINVFFSQDDGCYVADVPDLQTCSAFGETPEDAVREVQDAIETWIEAAVATARQVPEPAYRP